MKDAGRPLRWEGSRRAVDGSVRVLAIRAQPEKGEAARPPLPPYPAPVAPDCDGRGPGTTTRPPLEAHTHLSQT